MACLFFATFVLLLQLSHYVMTKDIPFDVCSLDGITPLFTPDGVDLEPVHPSPGSTVSFKINGNAGLSSVIKFKIKCVFHAVRGVSRGSFLAEVFYSLTVHGKKQRIKLYEESTELCKRITCPIEKGPVVFHYIKKLPPTTPPGEYFVRVSASDEAKVLLICLEITFTIGKRPQLDVVV